MGARHLPLLALIILFICRPSGGVPENAGAKPIILKRVALHENDASIVSDYIKHSGGGGGVSDFIEHSGGGGGGVLDSIKHSGGGGGVTDFIQRKRALQGLYSPKPSPPLRPPFPPGVAFPPPILPPSPPIFPPLPPGVSAPPEPPGPPQGQLPSPFAHLDPSLYLPPPSPHLPQAPPLPLPPPPHTPPSPPPPRIPPLPPSPQTPREPRGPRGPRIPREPIPPPSPPPSNSPPASPPPSRPPTPWNPSFPAFPLRPPRIVRQTVPPVNVAQTGSDLTTQTASAILAIHNDYRSNHNVPPLQWDYKLAASAQRWSDMCTMDHSGYYIGENLVMGGGQQYSMATKGVELWYNEGCLYDYDTPGKDMVAGHFTQVVWRASTQIGCGLSTCPNGVQYSGGLATNTNVLVCHYDPPGNFQGEVPYKENVFPPVQEPAVCQSVRSGNPFG